MGNSDTWPTRQCDCRAIIEQSESQPDRLTIYAGSGIADSELSEWITASEDSFVHLSLQR